MTSYVYRGRGETDVLYTSTGNGNVYAGFGAGGSQVAYVDGNEVFPGMHRGVDAIAVLDGSRVVCPFSHTQLGYIEGDQFYDGYGGGPAMLTLRGGETMALVAAAALTLCDNDLYSDGSSGGRRFSNADETSAKYHREHHRLNRSDEIGADDEMSAASPDHSESSSMASPLQKKKLIRVEYEYPPPSYIYLDDDRFIAERMSRSEYYERMSMPLGPIGQMPSERRSCIRDYIIWHNNIEKGMRDLWEIDDFDNLKEIAMNCQKTNISLALDRVNRIFIRRVEAGMELDRKRTVATKKAKVNTLRTLRSRRDIYCSLMFFLAAAVPMIVWGGEKERNSGAAIAVTTLVWFVFSYASCMRDWKDSCVFNASLLVPSDSPQKLAFSVLVGLAGAAFFSAGYMIASMAYLSLSAIVFVKFLLTMHKNGTVVHTSLHARLSSEIAALENNSDLASFSSKDKLDKLKKIIGEKEYHRLAKLDV